MPKIKDTTNWNEIDKLDDESIAKAVLLDIDAAPLESKGLTLVRAGRPRKKNPKQSTTIRLSPDVLNYFKATGKGWQTRIDEALKEWVKAHPS